MGILLLFCIRTYFCRYLSRCYMRANLIQLFGKVRIEIFLISFLIKVDEIHVIF